MLVDEIDNVISTLFQRRKSYVNPVCVFNLFSTSVQRRKGNFRRWFNVILPAGSIDGQKSNLAIEQLTYTSDTFLCFQGNYSNAIHEVHLAKPYSSELLCTLPKPICYHGAEMINDKIYIFGGKGKERTPYDDILVFDPVTNECRELSKLPYPLRYILTAQWENKVTLRFNT